MEDIGFQFSKELNGAQTGRFSLFRARSRPVSPIRFESTNLGSFPFASLLVEARFVALERDALRYQITRDLLSGKTATRPRENQLHKKCAINRTRSLHVRHISSLAY
jgi:hypothetical protein